MPTVPNVTCLGCGCACDDIEIVSDGTRIVEARHACNLGQAWFGDGLTPARTLVDGKDAGRETALEEAAERLLRSRGPLVYLAPDLSCEAQREGVAIADALRARLDSVTSGTVMGSVLAQQERGRAGATLGEVRNRADTIVFWGVDPAVRYPRYWTRYAPEPAGVHVPAGRASRTVVAVDVGTARGPADADVRVSIPPAHEVAAITILRAAIGNPAAAAAWSRVAVRAHGADEPDARKRSDAGDPAFRNLTPELSDFATLLTRARYVAIVVDAEPDQDAVGRDPGCADALIALGQALNAPTRCAISVLRAGGNRSGADAVLTWQTGYPTAMSFARGYPEYRPHEAGTWLRDNDLALVLGSTSALPDGLRAALATLPCVLIGPRASEAPRPSTHVVIDTAVAGIHEPGTAIRMDDVPLPLRPSVPGPPAAAAVLAALLGRINDLVRF